MLNVLVVDDNADLANLVCNLARLCGHQATAAHDGVDALEHLAESEYDLVILDQDMPRMSGIECLTRIHAEGGPARPPRVVLHTADDRWESRAYALGASAFVRKGSDVATLLQLFGPTPARRAA